MSESYVASRSTNKNKNDKEPTFTGRQRLGAVLAFATLGVTGGGAAIKHVHDNLQSPEPVATAEVHELAAIDAATKDQLILLQGINDGDKKIIPTGAELGAWKHLGHINITIQPGDTLSEAVLEAYKQHHSDEPNQGLTNDIVDSITITSNSYVERQRAEGGDGVIQPDTLIAASEVQSSDNREFIVVSGPLVYSTD